MKTQKERTDNLLKLLAEEKHHIAIINRVMPDINDALGHNIYIHSKRELVRIQKALNAYTNDEIALGRVLTLKEKWTVRRLMFNTQCIEWQKGVNDFELDEEQAEKLDGYQIFIIMLLLSFSAKKPLISADLEVLLNGVLTASQFEYICTEILLKRNTQDIISNVQAYTTINDYKKD